MRKILKHPQFISSFAQRSFCYCSSSTPGFVHRLLPAAVWAEWHQTPTCPWGSSFSLPFLPHLLKLWMTHSKILLTRLRSLPTQLKLCKNKHEPFFVFPVALGPFSSMPYLGVRHREGRAKQPAGKRVVFNRKTAREGHLYLYSSWVSYAALRSQRSHA